MKGRGTWELKMEPPSSSSLLSSPRKAPFPRVPGSLNLYPDPIALADNPCPDWVDLGVEGRLQPVPAPQRPGPPPARLCPQSALACSDSLGLLSHWILGTA